MMKSCKVVRKSGKIVPENGIWHFLNNNFEKGLPQNAGNPTKQVFIWGSEQSLSIPTLGPNLSYDVRRKIFSADSIWDPGNRRQNYGRIWWIRFAMECLGMEWTHGSDFMLFRKGGTRDPKKPLWETVVSEFGRCEKPLWRILPLWQSVVENFAVVTLIRQTIEQLSVAKRRSKPREKIF